MIQDEYLASLPDSQQQLILDTLSWEQKFHEYAGYNDYYVGLIFGVLVFIITIVIIRKKLRGQFGYKIPLTVIPAMCATLAFAISGIISMITANISDYSYTGIPVYDTESIRAELFIRIRDDLLLQNQLTRLIELPCGIRYSSGNKALTLKHLIESRDGEIVVELDGWQCGNQQLIRRVLKEVKNG